MTPLPQSLLSATGLLVLLIGLLCGAPLGRAVNRATDEERIRAWRVAHASLVGGGVMLLAIAPNLHHVALSPSVKLLACALLCISMGAFTFALIFGAWRGHRGTDRGIGAGGATTYAANLCGVGLSLLSVAMLAYGAAAGLLQALVAA